MIYEDVVNGAMSRSINGRSREKAPVKGDAGGKSTEPTLWHESNKVTSHHLVLKLEGSSMWFSQSVTLAR